MRRSVLSALLCFVTAHAAGAETITVGGVGSLTPLMRELGAQYSQKNPDIQVAVMNPPLGSGGSMRALMAGKLDLALLGRLPVAGESGQVAKWVRTPLVFATSSAGSKSLTQAQIADLYAGRKTTWDNGAPVRLVLRGAYESETLLLRAMSPLIDAAVGEALKRTDLPFAENDIVALETLARVSGSLGTTSLGLITTQGSRVTALAIDGQMPSVQALESGNYPWARQYYLVSKASPRPAVDAFIAYLQSPAALAAARKLNYVAAKP